jgi:DNA-binding transcriptional regulator GbsR (MarR family)
VTPDESRFVEDMGKFLGSYGMPPMAGRMWGWLLICEPPEQTAGELAEALQASRGAISGTARILETAGMVQRMTRRGDRREYFTAPPEGFEPLITSARAAYKRLREMADRALASMADRPPESRARLEEVRDVMAFIEVELPEAIERFVRERNAERERPAS